MVIIKPLTVSEIHSESNINNLVDEYCAAAAASVAAVGIEGAPYPDTQWDMYEMYEKTGTFKVWGAYVGDVLVGFIDIFFYKLPHYGKVFVMVESYFVAKEYRKTGAATKLRHVVEDYAKEVGAVALLFPAAIGTDEEKVMSLLADYKPTKAIFYKVIK